MDGWKRLGTFIDGEMVARKWTLDRVYKETKKRDTDGKGVSPDTVKSLIAGKKPVRIERVYVLLEVLGWGRETIDSVIAGGEPIPLSRDQELPTEILDQMEVLAQSIEESAITIRRMLARVGRSPH
jgi:hypothetical protein